MNPINEFDPIQGDFLDIENDQLVPFHSAKFSRTEEGEWPVWQKDSFSRVIDYLQKNPLSFKGVSKHKMESFRQYIHKFNPSENEKIRKVEGILYKHLIALEGLTYPESEGLIDVMLNSLNVDKGFSVEELTRIAKIYINIHKDKLNELNEQFIILNELPNDLRPALYQILEESPPISPEGKVIYGIDILKGKDNIGHLLTLIQGISSQDRGDVISRTTPLIAGITNGSGIEFIIGAVRDIPSLERDDVISRTTPLIAGITNGAEISTIFGAIRHTPSQDRNDVISRAVPLIAGMRNGIEISTIIGAIRDTLPLERDDVISRTNRLIAGKANVSQKASIIRAIVDIPSPERDDIISKVAPLIAGITNGPQIAVIIRTIRGIPSLERDDVIARAVPLIAEMTDGFKMAKILNTQRAEKLYGNTILKGLSDPDQKYEIANFIFEKIPMNEREKFISTILPFINNTTDYKSRFNLLRAIEGFLPHERGEITERAAKLTAGEKKNLFKALFICSIFPKETLERFNQNAVQDALSDNDKFLALFKEPSIYPLASDLLMERLDILLPYEIKLRTNLRMIKLIVKSLNLDEDHPLFQKVLECEILLSDVNNPKHPYKIHQGVLAKQNEQKALLKDYSTLNYNPFVSCLRKIPPPDHRITFKDLPEISMNEIKSIADHLNEKLRNASEEERGEIEDSMTRNYGNSTEAILSNSLRTNQDFIDRVNRAEALRMASDPNTECPFEFYQFQTFLKALVRASNEAGAFGLTKKEELFLRLSDELSLPPLILSIDKLREGEKMVLYKDLPRVSFDQLKKIHDDLLDRYNALPETNKEKMDRLIKDQWGEEETLLGILQRSQLVHDKYIQRWMNQTGEPDAPCPTHIFKIRFLVDRLSKESDKIGPTGLSQQEELFLAWSQSIRNCSIGLQSAIDLIYSGYQLQEGSKALQADEALAKLSKSISQEWVLSVFTDLTFLNRVTDGTFDPAQGSHDSLYLMNRLNLMAGLNHSVSFDPHAQVLNDRLVEKDTKTLAALLFEQLTPDQLINKTRNYFNAAMRDEESGVYQKLNQYFKKNGIKGGLELDKNSHPYLTRQGALELLIHLGYLLRADG